MCGPLGVAEPAWPGHAIGAPARTLIHFSISGNRSSAPSYDRETSEIMRQTRPADGGRASSCGYNKEQRSAGVQAATLFHSRFHWILDVLKLFDLHVLELARNLVDLADV